MESSRLILSQCKFLFSCVLFLIAYIYAHTHTHTHTHTYIYIYIFCSPKINCRHIWVQKWHTSTRVGMEVGEGASEGMKTKKGGGWRPVGWGPGVGFACWLGGLCLYTFVWLCVCTGPLHTVDVVLWQIFFFLLNCHIYRLCPMSVWHCGSGTSCLWAESDNADAISFKCFAVMILGCVVSYFDKCLTLCGHVYVSQPFIIFCSPVSH